jgi:integrase
VAAQSKPGRHADGGNLYLSISPNGGKRWTFLYTRQGRTREMGLGSAHSTGVSLAEAREKGREARRVLRQGLDPLETRRPNAGDRPTFGAFAEKYFTDVVSGFSNAVHREQWRTTIRTHAKPLYPHPVDAISTDLVLAVLRPLWSERSETAYRLRGRIEKILSAAAAKGLRGSENPARWRGHLDQLLPKRRRLTRGHHPALKIESVPDFMRALHDRAAPSARALEFLILTAMRSGEVCAARLCEFDLEKRVWTVPAARMKSRREHRVPLTDRMITLLQRSDACSPQDLVFAPSLGKELNSATFKRLLERMGFGEVTTHGFRSTFRDWCSEKTEFANEVAEMALAHTIANKTEAAYRRGDLFEKRRALMEAWGAYCASAAPFDGSSARDE